MQAVVGLLLAVFVKHAFLEEIGSPLKMAQCRAFCVHKFSPPVFGHKDRCPKSSQCGICWDTCRHHSNGFSNCTLSSTCGPGCETACTFMETRRGTQRAPVLVRRGEEVLKIHGEETRWPAPAPELEGPWVYLVMRRLKNAWRQITQTLDLSAKIPSGGMLRVLVVGRDGLVTIYGPAEQLGRGDDKEWHLREVSVIHQESVVIAEVAWEARYPRSLYLVTWEVAGGGLRGNLLTSSTCVALSLWPDTLFHVQVELMTPELEAAKRNTQRKSKELIIDTRRSAEMEVLMDSEDEGEANGGSEGEEQERMVEEEEDEDEVEEIVNPGSSSNSLYTVVVKTGGGNLNIADLELIAGAICALFFFSLLFLCSVWVRRRYSNVDKSSQLTSPVQGPQPTVSLVMVSHPTVNSQSISHEAVT